MDRSIRSRLLMMRSARGCGEMEMEMGMEMQNIISAA